MKAKKQDAYSDEQLAFNAQNGDNSAIGELYSRYYMLIFGKCLSFTKNTDDANDLAQDVMLKVIEKIGSFKMESKFSTWLYAITFNYCTDYFRKTKKIQTESFDLHYDIVDNSEAELESALGKEVKAENAEMALASISEEDLQLLLMKYHYKKSISQIQAVYKLSASAVKMRLSRARDKATIVYSSSLLTAA